MNSITYIGMDVHSTNYTLCAFTMEGQKTFAETRINPDVKELMRIPEPPKTGVFASSARYFYFTFPDFVNV